MRVSLLILINIFLYQHLISVHSLGRSIIAFSRCGSSIISSSPGSLPPSLFSLNPSQERVHPRIVMNSEWSVLPNHGNRNILVSQVHLIGQGVSEGPEAVLHQLVQVAVLQVREELLQIGPGSLGPGSYCHGSAIIEVSTGAGLEDMRALVIIASNKQAHTIGSLPIPLGADLHLVTKISNHP